MKQWQETIVNFIIEYGFRVAGALVILVIGVIASLFVGRWANRWLSQKAMHAPMRMLFVRIIRLCILALALILALDKFGVQIAPLIAGIGVLGVGIGLAAQGVLGNLVAGLTIIFTKPFTVGEYVNIVEVDGVVETIELFSTVLVRSDRSHVIIPNRKIVGDIVHNYGTIRQLSLRVGVAYDTTLPNALAAVTEILRENKLVLKDPAPQVGIEALADSAITLILQPWVKTGDIGTAQSQVLLAVVERFARLSISIPYPQREVRLLGSSQPSQ